MTPALPKPSPVQNTIIEYAIWKTKKDAREREAIAANKNLIEQITLELTAEKFHARAGTAASERSQS